MKLKYLFAVALVLPLSSRAEVDSGHGLVPSEALNTITTFFSAQSNLDEESRQLYALAIERATVCLIDCRGIDENWDNEATRSTPLAWAFPNQDGTSLYIVLVGNILDRVSEHTTSYSGRFVVYVWRAHGEMLRVTPEDMVMRRTRDGDPSMIRRSPMQAASLRHEVLQAAATP